MFHISNNTKNKNDSSKESRLFSNKKKPVIRSKKGSGSNKNKGSNGGSPPANISYNSILKNHSKLLNLNNEHENNKVFFFERISFFQSFFKAIKIIWIDIICGQINYLVSNFLDCADFLKNFLSSISIKACSPFKSLLEKMGFMEKNITFNMNVSGNNPNIESATKTKIIDDDIVKFMNTHDFNIQQTTVCNIKPIGNLQSETKRSL